MKMLFTKNVRSSSIYKKCEVVFPLQKCEVVFHTYVRRPVFLIRQFGYFSGPRRTADGRMDGGWPDGRRNTDNRANSAQVQLKLPTGAELGNNDITAIVGWPIQAGE